METKQKIKLLLFAMLGSFLMVATSGAESYQFVCGQQRTISGALQRLRPGETLSVSGACNENVQLPEQVVNITLDGQGRQRSMAQMQVAIPSLYEAQKGGDIISPLSSAYPIR